MPLFDFDGDKYRRASAHQKEWGGRLIAELDLRGNESILDLGCGDGVLTAELAARVPQGRVLGIDGSPGMIETAGRLACDNLRFQLLDINAIDFAAEFDVVFSNAALHWVKDHTRLLAAVHRSLRPGGRIRFNFAGEGNCAHFNKVVPAVCRDGRFARYFEGVEWPWYMPGLAEYEPLVRQAGFADARIWLENADRFFRNADEMTAWIDQPSLVPFLARIAEPDKQAFRDEVVYRMVAMSLQPDGGCFETFRRINVTAVRG
jgi:trans-aconitate 2-methyltransferase